MSNTLPNTGMTGDYNATTAESGWGLTMNTDLRVLDTLMQARVINRTTMTPPTTPADGDLYIVATGGTGLWAGQDQRLAVWRIDLSAWMFITPKAGWLVSSIADAYQQYRYNAGSWGLYTAPAALGVQTADGATVVTGFAKLVVDNGTLTDQGSGVARLAFAQTGVSAPNHQTVAAYTAVLADTGRLTMMDLTAVNTFTIPNDTNLALALGSKLDICQYNTGITSVAGDTSVVVHLAPGKTLMSANRYGRLQALKLAANEWLLIGDFAGASALVFNAQPNNYTLALTDGLDGRQCISNTGTAAYTLTIPLNSAVNLPIGQQIYGMASGVGSSWNIVGASGVTVVSLGAVSSAPVGANVGLPFVLVQTALNVWAVQGPIA